MRSLTLPSPASSVFALSLALWGTGCQKPVPPTPPPSEVSVLTIAPRQVEENVEFTGQVQAYRTVQVRSQATGIIVARPFREGAEVHAGEVLYRIDPVTAEAALRSARARLAEAQARMSNSEANAKRLRPLLAGNAVAKQDVENAESQVEQARASVEEATGAVDAARKGLDETTVRAELRGRVGRALLDVGGRVRGADDILTTLDVLDPVYVSFQPSSVQQSAWRRDAAMRKALDVGGSARVEATLPDGSVFPTLGRIGFVDPVIDPATGTQEYRAEFVNTEHVLLPGQFVHVRVRGLTHPNAIVIPQRAVLEQMGRQIVYVVGADNTVAAREVNATGWSDNNWLIEHGLAAGDRIIVDGVQKTGPGAKVKPVPFVDSSAVSRDAAQRGAAHDSVSAAVPAARTSR